MHINEDMVRRFFDRQCNEEEARIVADWLKDHPEAAEQYYNESDWADETGGQTPTPGWDEMWDGLRKRIRRRLVITRVAYALTACTCMLLLCIWISKPAKTPASQLAQAQPQSVADSIELRNDSDTSVQQVLPDGTTISLLPQSTVRFSHKRWKRSREVLVNGEVVFNVARDQERPFLAYCDKLSIQALGTVFSVRKREGDKDLKVRLYEGKVVVRPVKRNGKDVIPVFTNYLLPGQELIIPLNTYVPRKHYFLQGENGENFIESKQKNKTPGIRPTGWYEFTSQPLGDVFTTLEILYGVEIHYNKATLENLFFIGRFGPGDSIEDVLGTIALLNDLTVTKRSDNKYYVTKKG